MMAARMFTRFIWKPETTVKNTERPTRPGYFSIVPGGTLGRCGNAAAAARSFTAFHSGSHIGCHIGSMSHEQESSRPLDAHLGDPVDLLHRGVDVAVGQAGQADVPVGIVAAEVLQPVVVDAQHLVAGLAGR